MVSWFTKIYPNKHLLPLTSIELGSFRYTVSAAIVLVNSYCGIQSMRKTQLLLRIKHRTQQFCVLFSGNKSKTC